MEVLPATPASGFSGKHRHQLGLRLFNTIFHFLRKGQGKKQPKLFGRVQGEGWPNLWQRFAAGGK